MSEDGIRDEELEAGLGEAFRRREGESVLDAIERVHGVGSSVVLREGTEDPSPINLTHTDEGLIQDDDRYHVQGEIARGGIGVIFQGRDKGLNREIALKVLRPEYADREDVIQRFIEEAQVGGQLQHPGIVPVYGIGLQPDGRPSFAMKLIKGQTLAELLADTSRGIDLISVFEQIAQTMAYAHSRGVIHRDLKPANIMVGAFGEVQVVDWGFAKVLGREEAAPRPMETIVRTVRSGDEGSQSILGDVMGTPAYMPPEQALGRIDDLDARTDVFALGAILLEILTGEAAYTGRPQDQLVSAAQCHLVDAFERLDAVTVAAELAELVRDCLSRLGGDRPKDAGVVAQRLSDHLAGADERAREAELAALAASAEITRHREGRRRAMVLASVVLVAVLVGGGVYLWQTGKTEAREVGAAARISDALREASIQEGDGDWAAAAASAQSAVDVAASEGVDDSAARTLLARLKRIGAEAEQTARLDAEDDAFLAELEEIRGRQGQVLEEESRAPAFAGAPGLSSSPVAEALGTGGIQDAAGTDAVYSAAFERRFGSLDASAERLAKSRHAEAFAANLGFWYSLRRYELPGSDWNAIDALARRIDPSNGDVRDALVGGDADSLLALISKRGDDLPVALADQVGMVLLQQKRNAEAVAFLRRQFQRTPNDFWINVRLSGAALARARSTTRATERADGLALAKSHANAAIAARPGQSTAWQALRAAFLEQGDHRAALDAARRLAKLAPRNVDAILTLGASLVNTGELDEALLVLGRARSLDPERSESHEYIGATLRKKGDLVGAVAALRRAVKLEKGARAAVALAGLLIDRRDFDAAKEIIEGVIERYPRYSVARTQLGLVLSLSGDLEAGIEACRRAADLGPADWWSGQALATMLDRAGRHLEAAGEWRRLAEMHPQWITAHRGVVQSLRAAGDFDGALAAVARANEINPEFFRELLEKAQTLLFQGDYVGAAAACREHLESHPQDAEAHAMLSWALVYQQNYTDAITSSRRAVELEPKNDNYRLRLASALFWGWELDEAIAIYRGVLRVHSEANIRGVHKMLGTALMRKGETEGAIAAWRRAIELMPQDDEVHASLGQLLASTGDEEGARAVYGRLLRLNPTSVRAHWRAGEELLALRDLDGAIAALRRAIELDPSYPDGYAALARVHAEKNEPAAAEAAARKAIELAPAAGRWHANLALVLRRLGKVDAAMASHREAIELGFVGHVMTLAQQLIAADDFEGAIASCRRALEIAPDNSGRQTVLAQVLSVAGDFDAAIAGGRREVERTPKDPMAHRVLAVALANAGETDGAIAALRRALELSPTDVGARTSLAALLYWKGDRAGATTELNRAGEFGPLRSRRDEVLGAWLEGEDAAGSLAAFRRATEFDPSSPDARAGLANALGETGAYEESLALWRRALELREHPAEASFQVRRLERLIEMRPLVSRALAGKKLAVSPEDRAVLAGAVFWKHEWARASEMCARAFEDDPKLASREPRYRRLAIIAGIRAGGPWTSRAIAWLREDVAEQRTKLAADPLAVIRALRDWIVDPKLAPIRVGDDLPTEAKQFWAELDALIDEAKAQLKK